MSPRHALASTRTRVVLTVLAGGLGLAAAVASCSASSNGSTAPGSGAVTTAPETSPTASATPGPSIVPSPTATPTPTAETSATPEPTATAAPVSEFARPEWLGTTVLKKQDNGLGKPGATPAELRDRRLEPREGAYPDPEDDAWFATVSTVPADVLARSSWREECPVPASDLAYIVMPFWGFDGQAHTGEMITSAQYADDVVTAFEGMYERRFPIEEMRVTTWAEVNGAHTGDQNVTISFECRKVTGGYDVWSEHAKGLAIDINPFHNPWQRDGAVFPELARAYLDRDWLRPGMIETQQQIIDEFEELGWTWGGTWDKLDDWMHFSAQGG
ncbi:M15 family metallopeptidase [Demequina gelatinilytica]|uniref:M15 family metallopeptidase n=1 Tax=Demequina gelatinilytica TaxID=1638980 RepID=UPI0009E1E9A7|nr:M15 family metallopeptidase [Demequina gelatinilytica]